MPSEQHELIRLRVPFGGPRNGMQPDRSVGFSWRIVRFAVARVFATARSETAALRTCSPRFGCYAAWAKVLSDRASTNWSQIRPKAGVEGSHEQKLRAFDETSPLLAAYSQLRTFS
jgi:hypothetical protein